MSVRLNYYFFCLSLFVFMGSALAQGRLVRIDLKGLSEEDLARTGLAFDHGYYVPGESFTGDFSASEQKKLLASGFQLQQVESNTLRAPVINCKPGNVTPPYYEVPLNYEYGSMGGFLTLSEMYDNLDLMHELYPELVSVKTRIGNFTTEEGRPIYNLKISDHPTDNEAEPQVLYTALHHAREPASMGQMLFFMWYLLENYNRDAEVKKLVDSRELYFVPCVNPDGYRYNQTTNPSGNGFWRKNRAMNQDNTQGIDLNRNYGFQWGYNDIGSSANGEAETYRGESAFSEIETRALKELCIKHHFNIAVNYHTFGNILIIPWGYNDSLTKDNEEFNILAKDFTKYNQYNVGTATSTLNYQVNGVSDDWMYGDTIAKNKIFSFTPEVGPAFWPSRQEIGQINQQTQYMNFSAAWNAGSVAHIEESSPEIIEPAEGDLRLIITRTGIQDNDIKITASCDHPDQIVIDEITPFRLNMAETRTVKVRYHVIQSLAFQENVHFTFHILTGEYSEIIVSDKKFLGTPFWRDEANHTDYWSSSINRPLELNSGDYDSAPSCFSDSPQGERLTNQQYMMTTTDAINLQHANYAYLSYKLKFDLDSAEDYAQVLISIDGNRFYPVCGRYSVNGNFLQGIDQPVYAGRSTGWVTEWIDLSEFLGQQIRLQIKVGTGANGHYDGVNIDDLRIYTDLLSSVNESATQNILFPNPANDLISISDPTQEISKIQLYNGLGDELDIQWSRQGEYILCPSEGIPGGMYLLKIEKSNGRKGLRKVLIQH